nr:WYL domain-containing protein [Paenibacillus sp. SYP-B3998]
MLNHEVLSASELAERYQVSQRTIYRDIEAICAAGIPVVSFQGVNGGYGIIKEYKMDRSLLGSNDIQFLITLLHSAGTVFKDDTTKETIHRLQTIQRDNRPQRVTMDIGSWRTDDLHTLRSAITSGRVITFGYMNGKNERSERVVEPVSLLFKYYAWFLHGYCRTRQDYRMFKYPEWLNWLFCPNYFTRTIRTLPTILQWKATNQSK